MNAGMYGMADGRGMAGRKFVGRTPSVFVENSNAANSSSASTLGCQTSAIPLLGVNNRTRVFSVSGKGALRYAAFSQASGSQLSVTIEVVLDGTSISRSGFISHGSAALLCGTSFASYGGCVMDFWPFDSSCDIYLTVNGGATNWSGGTQLVVCDLHQ